MHDVAEEMAALERLARAHADWRAHRPAPRPEAASGEKREARLAEVWRKLKNPEPQDVEVIRAAETDPLGAAIWSQLSVVGWRLYAKGGIELLVATYRKLELGHHPGFVEAVRRAWQGLGFPGDTRGVWTGIELL